MLYLSVLLGLLAVPAAFADDPVLKCNKEDNNALLTIEDYQQTAARICGGQNSTNVLFGQIRDQQVIISALSFSPTLDNCWNAYNDIIGTCVQGQGKSGGDWTMDHDDYSIEGAEFPQGTMGDLDS